MLLIYEFCFYELFKLICIEIQGVKRNEENEMKSVMSESSNDTSVRDSLHTNIFLIELVMLLIKIISVSGNGIKHALHQFYISDLSSVKSSLSTKKSPQLHSSLLKKPTETETIYKSNFSSAKLDIDRICEQYNDQNRQIRRQETGNVTEKQIIQQSNMKVDELFVLCSTEVSPSKEIKKTSIENKNSEDPLEVFSNIIEYIQINSETLTNEILFTQKSNSLQCLRLVILTHLNYPSK